MAVCGHGAVLHLESEVPRCAGEGGLSHTITLCRRPRHPTFPLPIFDRPRISPTTPLRRPHWCPMLYGGARKDCERAFTLQCFRLEGSSPCFLASNFTTRQNLHSREYWQLHRVARKAGEGAFILQCLRLVGSSPCFLASDFTTSQNLHPKDYWQLHGLPAKPARGHLHYGVLDWYAAICSPCSSASNFTRQLHSKELLTVAWYHILRPLCSPGLHLLSVSRLSIAISEHVKHVSKYV